MTGTSLFSLAKRIEIWSAIDLVIVKLDGAELKEASDAVGTDVEQFIAQQSREPSALADLSLLLALLQHFIMPSFGSCRGVPASTPLASERITITNVNHLTIRLNIVSGRRNCQSV
jgi:hypothetical protein